VLSSVLSVVDVTRRDEARRLAVALYVNGYKRIMIRNLCRVASPRVLQENRIRAKHAMADVLTDCVPFSRDFLFRQVTLARRITDVCLRSTRSVGPRCGRQRHLAATPSNDDMYDSLKCNS